MLTENMTPPDEPTPPTPAGRDRTIAGDPLATTIRPTLGRIVLHYRPHDPVSSIRPPQPLPGMVYEVVDKGPGTVPEVSVETAGPNGVCAEGMPLYDAGKGPKDEERCEWMPYQMTAAANKAA